MSRVAPVGPTGLGNGDSSSTTSRVGADILLPRVGATCDSVAHAAGFCGHCEIKHADRPRIERRRVADLPAAIGAHDVGGRWGSLTFTEVTSNPKGSLVGDSEHGFARAEARGERVPLLEERK